MSTRIYGGLRYTGSDPFQAGLDIRAVLEPIYFKKMDKLIELIADRIKPLSEGASWEEYEKALLGAHIWFRPGSLAGWKPRHPRYDPELLAELLLDINDKSSSRLNSPDFKYVVDLIKNADPDDTKPVLALVAGGESVAYTKALIKSGLFEEFHYQDQSDRDGDVSDEDWNQRKRAWGALIEGVGAAPREVGLSVESPGSLQYGMYTVGKRRKEAEEKP